MKKNSIFIILMSFLLVGQVIAQYQPDGDIRTKLQNNIKDAPGSPVFFVDPFDTDPVLSLTQAPGTWYVDRFAPAGFAKFVFSGNVLKHSISTADASLNRPAGQQSTFYNTQGRKYDISNGNNTSIIADLYIPADWQTSHRRADIWATGFDNSDVVSAYPIIGFANTTGLNPTFRAYNSNDGLWYNSAVSIAYDQWYSLKIELVDNAINYYVNNVLVYSYIPDPPATTYLGNLMLQAYNFGDPTLPPESYALESYDVYWDNVGAISKIKNVTLNSYYNSLQEAIDAANPGDNILLAAGTYPLASQVTINKANLTIQGESNTNTILQVSGTGERLFISSPGVTLKNFQIQKTDKVGQQNIIYIGASNTTIKDNIIFGQFIIGEGDVSRAMVITGGLTGLLIEGNTIHSLRQPGYMTGPTTGSIINNNVYLTKGWVMEGGDVTFTGNLWGTGANSNVYDIVVLSIAPPTAYTDIVAMSDANNGAIIEDQRVSPPVLSAVYVDGSTSFVSDLGGRYHPYSTITPSIARVVSGGKVYVAAGTYLEDLYINKTLKMYGANMNTTVIKGLKTLGSAGQTLLLGANNITLSGFTITRDGNNVTDWNTTPKTTGIIFGQLLTGCIVENCIVTGNRNGIYLNNTQGHIIRNNIVDFNRTGIQLVNDVSNCLIEDNIITNNWTVGFVIYYASTGLPATVNLIARDNDISGNWYSQVDCKTSQPNPSTSYDFRYNWYGSEVLNVTNTPSGEPGYAAQIPVVYGGSAVSPGTNQGKISGDLVALVIYDPWVGKSQNLPIVQNTPISFPDAHTTITFTTLPPGSVGNVSVQYIPSGPPAGYPAPPASAGPAVVYLNITAPGLINYTFSATVVLDVSTIPGFVPGTEVMFYSTVSNSWVGINGTYDAMAQTYTFVTDHFTPFAYVNPANPDGLYISQSITGPQMNQRWYPQVGMGNPSSYGANDWTYVNDTARFYMIPAGTQGIYAAKFMVTWDKSKANLTVANGNLWGSNMFYQAVDSSSGNNGKYWFNISSNDLTNAVPDTTGGKYLAVLKFAITKPGYIPVSIIGTDFRYYHASGDSTSGVYVTTNPGAMVFYLGDFESPSSQNIGDGKINATDISNFSTAYWSLNTNPLYRAKYDVGPTNTSGSYFAMPTPDNKIEFEDLVIFSIGYGKTGAGQLNRIKSEEPVVVSAGTMTMGEDGLYRLPVNLNGPVYDVRALSIGLNYNSSTLEYAGVEKQGELTTNTSFLIGKAEGNKIYMDASLVGTDNGISTEGTTANILFREKSAGNHDVTINSVILRNSYNEEIEARFGTEAGSLIPKTFGLSQNYPNPFNPATTIKYQIPATVKVTIRVYDLLGREVVTLVNGVQEAGYYSAEWNAQNYASGVYFYKMIAGDFENVKKLVLVK